MAATNDDISNTTTTTVPIVLPTPPLEDDHLLRCIADFCPSLRAATRWVQVSKFWRTAVDSSEAWRHLLVARHPAFAPLLDGSLPVPADLSAKQLYEIHTLTHTDRTWAMERETVRLTNLFKDDALRVEVRHPTKGLVASGRIPLLPPTEEDAQKGWSLLLQPHPLDAHQTLSLEELTPCEITMYLWGQEALGGKNCTAVPMFVKNGRLFACLFPVNYRPMLMRYPWLAEARTFVPQLYLQLQFDDADLAAAGIQSADVDFGEQEEAVARLAKVTPRELTVASLLDSSSEIEEFKPENLVPKPPETGFPYLKTLDAWWTTQMQFPPLSLVENVGTPQGQAEQQRFIEAQHRRMAGRFACSYLLIEQYGSAPRTRHSAANGSDEEEATVVTAHALVPLADPAKLQQLFQRTYPLTLTSAIGPNDHVMTAMCVAHEWRISALVLDERREVHLGTTGMFADESGSLDFGFVGGDMVGFATAAYDLEGRGNGRTIGVNLRVLCIPKESRGDRAPSWLNNLMNQASAPAFVEMWLAGWETLEHEEKGMEEKEDEANEPAEAEEGA